MALANSPPTPSTVAAAVAVAAVAAVGEAAATPPGSTTRGQALLLAPTYSSSSRHPGRQRHGRHGPGPRRPLASSARAPATHLLRHTLPMGSPPTTTHRHRHRHTTSRRWTRPSSMHSTTCSSREAIGSWTLAHPLTWHPIPVTYPL